MALEEGEHIIVPGENGEENLFEVLFTFDVEENNQTYIALVPAEAADDEEVEVYAFRYEEAGSEEDDLALFPIESDEEWDMVEEVLNTLIEEDEMS